MSSFNDFELNPKLAATVAALGYETPSPIQIGAIPILKKFEKDFIGLAPTGTGKTAAFGLPLINRLSEVRGKGTQALILCPTRELALQVSGQIDKFGKGLNLNALPVYGGAGYRDQIRGLKAGTPIVVGTPGRVLDHLRSGTLDLSNLQCLILDEADEMISMGFQEDIETVLAQIPKDQAKIWLFSATMNAQIRKIANSYLTKPDMVELLNREKVPTQLEQIFFVTRESNKPDVLVKLMEEAGEFYGLIFCQTKALVVELTQHLVDKGYKADSLHGDKTQDARERTLRSFREKKLSVLVCTDVASRGIDVNDITHVINYSLPRELENYIHRIGRTARSGKKGIAFSLVTPSHRALVGRIEKVTGTKMKEGVIPSNKILREKQLGNLLTTFQAKETNAEALKLVSGKWAEAVTEMSKEEIVTKLLMMVAPDLLDPKKMAAKEETQSFERDFKPRANFDDRGGGFRGRRDNDRGGSSGGARGYSRDGGGSGRSGGYDKGPRRDAGAGPAARPAWNGNSSARPVRRAEGGSASPRKWDPSGPPRAFNDRPTSRATTERAAPRAYSPRPAASDSAPVRSEKPSFREEARERLRTGRSFES